jgi:hypothetical protein
MQKKDPDQIDSGPVVKRRDYAPFSLGEENSHFLLLT